MVRRIEGAVLGGHHPWSPGSGEFGNPSLGWESRLTVGRSRPAELPPKITSLFNPSPNRADRILVPAIYAVQKPSLSPFHRACSSMAASMAALVSDFRIPLAMAAKS